MANRFILPTWQVFDGNGDPLAGAKLYFYDTGTLDAKNTYSDNALSTPNANPVVADSAGRFGDIFLEAGTYRVVLKDSNDVEIWDRDPVAGGLATTGAVDEETSGFSIIADDNTKVMAVDASGGAVTAAVLSAATAGEGYEVTVVKTDSSTSAVTIDPNGAETIGGAATYTLTLENESVTFRSDGTNWVIVSTAKDYGAADIISAKQLADGALGFTLINGYLETSVGSNALSIAVKNKAGNNPSTSDPVLVLFRNATAATGDYTVLSITSSLSLTVSSGSTLGASNGVAFRLWVVLFNDGGTARLGVIKTASSSNVYGIRDDVLESATAEGGAGGADSAQTIYAGATVTTKAMRIVGYLDWDSGLSTAGTWDAEPDTMQLFHPGVTLPGQVVHSKYTEDGAVATGTTATPNDDTIPQNDEGDQYLSLASDALQSPCNILRVTAKAYLANTAQDHTVLGLFTDSDANARAVSVTDYGGGAVDIEHEHHIRFSYAPGAATAVTFKLRGGAASGTTTFNGASGSRKYGGVLNSMMEIEEIAA